MVDSKDQLTHLGGHDEIERKFLLKELPPTLDRSSGIAIVQGFVDDDLQIRLRILAENSYFLTIKSGSGMVRREYEIELTKKQFETIWPLTLGRRIHKTRFEIETRNQTIVIDEFHGRNAGLLIAEIEFSNVQEAESFSRPEWVGDEITGNTEYFNHRLAID